MFRITLSLVLLLTTSCLAVPVNVADGEGPSCKDLESLAEWNAGKATEQQYTKLKQICQEAVDVKSAKTADDVVTRMIRCGKMEHSYNLTDPIKKEELENCNVELNCFKRFYMEEAKLKPEDFTKEFPLMWRAKEVQVESPPSDTDSSKPACSKFSKRTMSQDTMAALGIPAGLEMNLEKVKGDLMKQIHKDKAVADKIADTTNTNPVEKEEDFDRDLDKLISDIIDSILYIMKGDAAVTQEETGKMLNNMQKLYAIVSKYNKNSLAATLLESALTGLSNGNALGPIDVLVNTMFDAIRQKKGKQGTLTQEEVQPVLDEMDYYSKMAPGAAD